jgi:cysteine desulfurase/selenocysteine lyase
MQHLSKDDEIILSVMEHHANIVPWHFLRERLGVRLKWVDCDSNGNLDPQRIIDQFTENTKLLAITHMSNVLGTVVDVRTLCHEARTKGIVSLVDGSQAAVHMPVNVSDIGCDFYAITGHKLCGPSGSGALYVRNEMQKTMRPFLGGGDMIKDVFKDKVIYNDPPMKFEAGTPGIVQTIGLGVALEYMMNIGMDNIKAYENDLTSYARQRLEGLNWLNIQGKPDKKGAIFAFTLEGSAHAHDISTILDKQGIAVRAGQHCAGPLMHHMGINASCRASFAFYNTKQEVDKLLSGLELARDLLS